jgi:hypothetical protein
LILLSLGLLYVVDYHGHLIEHPFFIELLKQLRINYSPPDRKTLAESFLTQEIVRVNVKLYRLLDNESNLTLGKNVFEILLKC